MLLALIPQLVGHSTYNWALKYLPASFVAVTLLGEPIGSTILAFLIFQQSPGWIKILGGVLILAGIYLVSRTRNRVLTSWGLAQGEVIFITAFGVTSRSPRMI